MAEKMTRRTFMKSAAAAAAAISLSGVLTGCGGSGQLAGRTVRRHVPSFRGRSKAEAGIPRRDFLCLRHDVGQALCHRGKRSEAELPRCRNQGSLPEWSACGAEDRHQRHQRDAVPCQEEWRLCSHQDPAFPYHGLTRRPFCPEHSLKECPGLFVVLPNQKMAFSAYLSCL